ncbi:MAG: hypothetical protein LC777_04510 [Actinobacteria bacterium]|nr:hypothetical protein [Actinomycetota bacterium]
MRRFRRGLLAPILATVALLVGAPAALAQCEPGDYVSVYVELRQRPNNSGSGYTSFQCTETNQTFVIDVVGQKAFHPGPATLIGSAYRYDPDFGEFASDRDIEAIRLQR